MDVGPLLDVRGEEGAAPAGVTSAAAILLYESALGLGMACGPLV
ncbi:hypothetical protein AB0M87_03345 [Streptomyces sp. NPDC051320]